MFCLKCRYPLHSLSTQHCPECGRWFDAADPATYAPTARWIPLPADGTIALVLAIASWAYPFLMPNPYGRPSLIMCAPFMICCAFAIGFAVGGLRRRKVEDAGRSLAALAMSVLFILFFASEIGWDMIWEYWTYWFWVMPWRGV